VKYPEGSGGNIKKHLHLDKENFKKKKKRAIIQILNPWDSLCLPVPLSSPFSMLRNLKFPTLSGRRNGCGCEKEIDKLWTRNNKPKP
jgi:hypothetical protein